MTDKTDPDVQALAAEMKHLREDFGRIGKVVEELVRHRGSAAAAEASRTAEKAWDEVSKTARKRHPDDGAEPACHAGRRVRHRPVVRHAVQRPAQLGRPDRDAPLRLSASRSASRRFC